MNAIQLDDLVLQACASHMDIRSRIQQELVNRRLAKFLQLTNKFSEISLTLQLEYPPFCQQFCISVNCGTKCVDWKIKVKGSILLQKKLQRKQRKRKLFEESVSADPSISTPRQYKCGTIEAKVYHVLMQIFSRFKRFNRLVLSPWMHVWIDFLLNILSLEKCQLTSIKQLAYKGGGEFEEETYSSYEFSQRDCNLIEMLSPMLKELMILVAGLPYGDTDLSKKFWSTVSKCAQLKKIYLCHPNKTPTLIFNAQLRDCLRSLKVREFHTFDWCEKFPNAEWLIESFENNTNLRKLNVNSAEGPNMIAYLSTPAMLSVIARLRTVEIGVFIHDIAEISEETNIREVLRALHENGCLNVSQAIGLHGDTTTIDINTIAVEALAFWIRLSDETKRKIRLYACVKQFVTQTTTSFRFALDDLEKQKQFAGIRIVHHTKCSILQFNNANITLFYKLLAFKNYLTEEYLIGHIAV